MSVRSSVSTRSRRAASSSKRASRCSCSTLLVGVFLGRVGALRALDERRGDGGRHDREQRDALEHHGDRHDAPGEVLRRDVAVAHGRDRLQRPPHAAEDARVLAVVEQRHEHAAHGHDDRGDEHDRARSAADRHRLAQELRHRALDEDETGDAAIVRSRPDRQPETHLTRVGRANANAPCSRMPLESRQERALDKLDLSI